MMLRDEKIRVALKVTSGFSLAPSAPLGVDIFLILLNSY